MSTASRGAFLATVVIALANAGVAHAGTYVINDCPSAPTASSDSGPWTVFDGPQGDKGACSGGAGDWIGPLGGTMSPGALDGVEVAVPGGSGITIHEAEVWWSVPSSISGATTFAVASTNSGLVGNGNTPQSSSTTPDDFILPSSSTWFQLGDYCSGDDAGAGCTFGGGENPNLQLFGAQLTLSYNGLPSGSVTGGALAGSGPVAGTQSLAYGAADTYAGVRLVQLLLDGQEVAQHDYRSECPYTNFAACPTTLSDTLGWDTTSAANGSHDLALRIINAAGNATVVDDHTITVQNPANPVPVIPNGQTPCAGATINLTVNGRRRPAPVQYGKPVTIKGVLECGTVAIRDARIAVTIIGAPAHAAIATGVQTDADGSFSYAVPRGPDRRFQFAYTAYSTDPAPAATATATIAVLPKIRLRIAPRRTFNGHTMRWTGTITGGPYPPGGVTLEAEVREGTRWTEFDQIQSNRKGRFRYSYRFHATFSPTAYTFRVALPESGSGSYPYASWHSNELSVDVSP
jgi:hypothetical protein